MKNRYVYRLFASHSSVLFVTLILLILSFNLFLPDLMYRLKEQELTRVGAFMIKQNLFPSFGPQNMGQQNMAERINIQVVHRDASPEEKQFLCPTGLTLEEGEWNQLNGGQGITLKQGMNRFGLPVTVVVLPIKQDEALWLAAPVTETEEAIGQARNILLWSSLATLGVVLFISWFISRGLNRRILTMRRLAQQLANGDYGMRIPSLGKDEIADLALDLNRMADRLETAKEEMGRYDQARSRFLADISHELKTPLTSIRGLVDALRNHFVKEEERERIYFLIEKETLRLIRLVQSVMELEKMRAGKMELKMGEFPLYPVLEDIVEQMSILAEEKDLCLFLGGDPETIVYGDEDRLRQLAINLIKNALQFTEKGEIQVQTWNEGGKTYLTVADTGVGLTEEQSRDIFERFYKVDPSRATSTGEMGLGLAMAKQIVLSHGGEIKVESQPDQGAKFIVILPVKK